ncbi:hypothetical protein CDD83_31 [Cordyceps sp. RAO-2017]|nr:hypothetical protein CDD83_31 [Cordyceps sp. RAO-2017]
MPTVVEYGISGLGPRTVLLVAYLAITTIAERPSFEEVAKANPFKIRLTIFEKQDERHACCGEAYHLNSQATMNTGIPGPEKIRNQDKIPVEFHGLVSAITNLAEGIAGKLEPEAVSRISDLREMNVVAACMMANVISADGKLDVSIPFVVRAEMGKLLRTLFQKTKQLIRHHVPELEIVERYSAQVEDVDLSNPTHPALIVKHSSDGHKGRYVFDCVHFNNGPTLKPTAPDPVSLDSYSSLPNRDAVRAYLAGRGLLDEHDYLKPNSSILISGMGLSAADYFCILIGFTRILSLCSERKVLSYGR